jgi:predicted GIY-YIG superfamily endonuclease
MEVWVYILKCSDGSYYTGLTQDLETRLAQHWNGTFRGYTESRRPARLVFSEAFSTYDEAIAAERRIKGWSRKKKEALIRRDFELLHELAQCQNQSHYANRGLK